jgi:hypothetical protein
MDHQYGDGLARTSVDSLIRELDTGMRDMRRGGCAYLCKIDTPVGITGMNLAIVKTLLIHMNKLQDRIELLEGQLRDMPSTAPSSRASASPPPATGP